MGLIQVDFEKPRFITIMVNEKLVIRHKVRQGLLAGGNPHQDPALSHHSPHPPG
jgi:hypothetical protein